jgi:GT2 family glycosyltransferase
LCIINYNGAAILPGTLEAAVPLETSFSEILLVDNGSTDESLTLVKRRFPGVRIVEVGENRGAGGARNVGLEAARSNLILFIDNDVSITHDCAKILQDALKEHPNAVMAAPTVLYARNPSIVQYDGAENHYLGMMIVGNEDCPLADQNKDVHKTTSMVTCAFMIDRIKVPGDERFDEDYFIYVEDHDFSVRMTSMGLDILSVPQAQVIHGDGTENLSVRRIGGYSSGRVFLMIRNRWLFLLKNYSFRSLVVLAPMLLAYEIAQCLVVLKKGWLREWLRAVGWILRNFPKILDKRRAIQRARKVPESSLLNGGRIPFRGELATSRLERLARNLLDTIAIRYWKSVEDFI